VAEKEEIIVNILTQIAICNRKTSNQVACHVTRTPDPVTGDAYEPRHSSAGVVQVNDILVQNVERA
jgi:hypothetical protein